MKKIMRVKDIVLMNITAVLSLRWLPIAAAYGASAPLLWVIAASVFFIPLGLVATELATAWPQEGGVYIWVKQAFGERIGFLTAWFYWTNSFFFYPSLLTFIVVTIAFLFNPALATSKVYVCSSLLISLWSITILNFKSMRVLKWLANCSGILGILLPGIIIILLGVVAVVFWKIPIPTDYSMAKLLPDFSTKSNIAFLATLMFSMAGIELTPTIAGETENPRKTFPRALFISAVIVVMTYIMGTVALTLMIAPEHIGAASGVMDALKLITAKLHVPFITPLVGLMLALSGIGCASVWLVVPIKMLLESCKGGILPKAFSKTNAEGMPRNAIIIQSSAVTIIVLSTAFLTSVNSFYELMVLMATITYFIPYLALFLAFIKLRVAHPHHARPYKVPGGNIGAWIIALVGFSAVTMAIILPFVIPPQDINTAHDILLYRIEIACGPVFFAVLGYLIYYFYSRKKRRFFIF